MGFMYIGLEENKEGLYKLVVFYEECVKGGVGLIVMGGFLFNLCGCLYLFSVEFSKIKYVKVYKVVIEVVYCYGVKIVL